MALKNLNKPVPRIEGADKVSGRTRYAADIPVALALSAKILRTSLPHARIVGIDASKAEKLLGVRAVIKVEMYAAHSAVVPSSFSHHVLTHAGSQK